MPERRLRVAELAAALSVASDLGTGRDEAHGIRATVLAMRHADQLGLDVDDRRSLFWIGLLGRVGCSAMSSTPSTEPPPDRVAAFLGRARLSRRVTAEREVAVTEIAQVFARRLGLDEQVVQAFGNPDPRLAEAIAATETAAAAGTSSAGIDELLALEPLPHHVTDPAGVDELLPLFGIMADWTAPFLLGHSDRVARLASAAAGLAGLWPHDVTLVRRTGWVHDIGRLSVSSAIWTKLEPLTDDERDAIRLHPYFTARVLVRTSHLATLADVAAAHHERLDGSGYHRGLAGVAIDPLAMILAAADAYVSAGEWRPHRPARPPAEQAYLVLGLARDGALPHWAVDAVIAAARTPVSAPQRVPNPLTVDEQRLLDLLAAGSSEAAIGRQLGLTALGVRAEIKALYAKLGASTRASAVVVALDNGWLDLASRPLTL